MMKTKNRNQRTAHKLLAQADELTVRVMRSRSDRQARVEFELRGWIRDGAKSTLAKSSGRDASAIAARMVAGLLAKR